MQDPRWENIDEIREGAIYFKSSEALNVTDLRDVNPYRDTAGLVQVSYPKFNSSV